MSTGRKSVGTDEFKQGQAGFLGVNVSPNLCYDYARWILSFRSVLSFLQHYSLVNDSTRFDQENTPKEPGHV